MPGENTKFEDAAIEPDELFNQTWSLIKSSYFDDDMNEQNWARWKKRYSHKIKTEEDAKVAIRNVRRDANDEFKKLQKNGEITEDALKGYTEDVQKLTDKKIKEVDAVADEKEKDIMSI